MWLAVAGRCRNRAARVRPQRPQPHDSERGARRPRAIRPVAARDRAGVVSCADARGATGCSSSKQASSSGRSSGARSPVCWRRWLARWSSSGVLAIASSSRGLGGTISHAWKNFTTTRAGRSTRPIACCRSTRRTAGCGGRRRSGAFSDRPIAGWGAGSFRVVHLLYRRDTLSVNQPHSVPLQFLAETGVVGAMLAIAGFGLLLAAGVRAVRRDA